MALSVTTIAPTLRLTTRQSVAAMGLEIDGALADSLIDEASAAIRSYCHQNFAREAYTETLPGFGDVHLQLARTPVVSVSTVTYRSSVITDYSIAEPGRGWLYRQNGWAWTAQVWPGLSGGGAWLDMGTPLPGQEEPTISVDYTAGYVLPEQNVQGEVTVAASDDSFNSAGAQFPALMKAGDVIETTGFENPANNSRFSVVSATTSKIVVSGSLTDQGTANSASIVKVSTLPADVQKAANECVKTWYLTRRDNPSIVEKQAGPHRLRFSEQEDVQRLGLPAVCVGLLRPWVRAA